ncbi:2,3-bisphosphoglycerate-independent phosphoglycerate mutase [Nitrospira sp. Kam-Ns4a]
MKYVILHGGGLVEAPHPDLGGKTLLQAAATPNLDWLARHGELGLATVPLEGVTAGSDTTQLAVLGYDPRNYHPGPGPFEAASLGVVLGEHDVAFRCSMVTVQASPAPGRPAGYEVRKLAPHVVLEDDGAGGITTEEARELLDAVNEQLGSEAIQFYPGVGHRHVMVWVGGKARVTCVPPREVVGRPIGDALPSGDGAEILRQLMEASLIILRSHPVNEERQQAGLKPANCLWLWGQGKAPRLPKLTDLHPITGAIVSARDLHRGIGICAGLDAAAPGSFGDGTDFSELAAAALGELEKRDFVYVHAELPDEVRRAADLKARVNAVEEFDRLAVGALREGLPRLGPHRLLVVCDGVTLRDGPARAWLPVPYALYQGPGASAQASPRGYSEIEAEAARTKVREATSLIKRLLASG